MLLVPKLGVEMGWKESCSGIIVIEKHTKARRKISPALCHPFLAVFDVY